MYRMGFPIALVGALLALASPTRAGVYMCVDDDDVRNWTIALGSTPQQARANALEIMGGPCAKYVQCDGGGTHGCQARRRVDPA